MMMAYYLWIIGYLRDCAFGNATINLFNKDVLRVFPNSNPNHNPGTVLEVEDTTLN